MARPNDHGDFGAAEDPDHYGASDPAADRYMDESMAEDVGDFGVDDESTFGYASVTSSVTRETLGGGTATQAPSVVSRGETTANGGADVESSSGDTEIRRSMSSNRSDAGRSDSSDSGPDASPVKADQKAKGKSQEPKNFLDFDFAALKTMDFAALKAEFFSSERRRRLVFIGGGIMLGAVILIAIGASVAGGGDSRGGGAPKPPPSRPCPP